MQITFDIHAAIFREKTHLILIAQFSTVKQISKKKFYLAMLFCLGLIYCSSQTYIGVSLGLDYSKVEEQFNDVGFRILEPGFSNKSMLFGLRVEQSIGNSFFLSLQSQYNKKTVGATDRGFLPLDALEFKCIKSSLRFNWVPMNALNLGIGLHNNYISEINRVDNGNVQYKISGKVKEVGIGFSIGYIFKHFFLEFDYANGLGIVGSYENSKSVKPIDSFGLSLSYMIEVIKRSKGKKVNCPRI
ncbi:MAG: hypothetical protein GC192_12585 [Bacteroidetes bacterium]|nr:hypothetical protein [Bacteroidota bacterium]